MIGHRSVFASDPFWNDYRSETFLEGYVSTLCILVEFPEDFLVEVHHELTQKATLGVSKVTAR